MIYIDESEQEPEKIIFIQRNGDHNSKRISKVVLKSGITFLDIQIKVQRDLKLGYTENFRLFNREGVEIFEDDIPFLQNNLNLLASMGEDYDSSTGFSQYQMIKVIGEGGFGKVVLAEHQITKERVAIKFVNTSLIGNASDIDMVFREAEVLKNLSHRNIVKIFNCYTLKGMEVVFIMEYLEGGELLEYITKKGRLTELEARQFFRQMVDAIHYCHKENVIHRDLKLENILLLQQNSTLIKIIDFGIAGVGNLNTNKLNVGSLRYMAPEVLLKQVQSLQKSIDIWSLGVILYCLVVGTLPFNGDSPNEIIRNITQGIYCFPSSMEGLLTDEIKDLIEHILVIDPNKRFSLKQIKQHEWMKLSSLYLYEQQLMIQQMQQQALRKREKNQLKFGLLNSREQTLRGLTGGVTKIQSGSGSETPNRLDQKFAQLNLNSPLREQSKLGSMREKTLMRSPNPSPLKNGRTRDNTYLLKEPTRMNGGGGMRSPISSPLKSILNSKKQNQSPLIGQYGDSQSQHKDLIDDLKQEDQYYSQENVVEDQINEIKRVLGLQVAPVKSHQSTQRLLTQTPSTSELFNPNNQQITSQNSLVKVIKRNSREQDQFPYSKENNKLAEISSSHSPLSIEKRTSLDKSNILKDLQIQSQQQASRIGQNQSVNKETIQLPSLQDQGSLAKLPQKEEQQADNENVKDDEKKEQPYYRLVYMLRQIKQEEIQGNPALQINKDYRGIYKPQEIGFVSYTANTNLRSLQTSPTRYTRRASPSPSPATAPTQPRKKSFSPKRQEEIQENSNVFSPQRIFQKKPYSVKYINGSKLNASYN